MWHHKQSQCRYYCHLCCCMKIINCCTTTANTVLNNTIAVTSGVLSTITSKSICLKSIRSHTIQVWLSTNIVWSNLVCRIIIPTRLDGQPHYVGKVFANLAGGIMSGTPRWTCYFVEICVANFKSIRIAINHLIQVASGIGHYVNISLSDKLCARIGQTSSKMQPDKIRIEYELTGCCWNFNK